MAVRADTWQYNRKRLNRLCRNQTSSLRRPVQGGTWKSRHEIAPTTSKVRVATPNASCSFRSSRDAVFISPDFALGAGLQGFLLRVGALVPRVRYGQLPTGDRVSMRRYCRQSDMISSETGAPSSTSGHLPI